MYQNEHNGKKEFSISAPLGSTDTEAGKKFIIGYSAKRCAQANKHKEVNLLDDEELLKLSYHTRLQKIFLFGSAAAALFSIGQKGTKQRVLLACAALMFGTAYRSISRHAQSIVNHYHKKIFKADQAAVEAGKTPEEQLAIAAAGNNLLRNKGGTLKETSTTIIKGIFDYLIPSTLPSRIQRINRLSKLADEIKRKSKLK